MKNYTSKNQVRTLKTEKKQVNQRPRTYQTETGAEKISAAETSRDNPNPVAAVKSSSQVVVLTYKLTYGPPTLDLPWIKLNSFEKRGVWKKTA